MPPEVSILIVLWNSGRFLPRCLESLAHQTDTDFEVLLLDNCSTDGAAEGLNQKYPALPIRLERLDSNRGFAAANNIGARIARGSWLALLNPDAYPEPTWLEEFMANARGSTDAFFACRQIQANNPRLLDGEGDIYHVSGLAFRRNYNFPVFAAGEPREVFSACAAAALYPRQAFLDAGGFDEDYFAYHEDVDLGFRLRLRGMRCVLIPAAVVHHVGTASTGPGSDFSTFYGHRNLVWTFVKDMPSPWLWIHLPLHLAVNIALTIYFGLTGRGRANWRAKIDAVRGLRSAIAKRGPIQADRRVRAWSVIRAMNRNPFAPLEGWIARHHPSVQ